MQILNAKEASALVQMLNDKYHFANFLISTIQTLSRSVSPIQNLESLSINKTESGININTRMLLRSKFHTYSELSKTQEDKDGFIESQECDSMLFSGLYASATNRINILAARDDKGLYHRRPLDRPCYPCESKSSFSRDMATGLLWYLWRSKNLDLAIQWRDAIIKNNYLLGDGYITRLWFGPGLQATLAEIIFQLGGPNHKIERNFPQIWPKGLEDYELHLQVLHILLRGELLNAITKRMMNGLKDAYARNPNNPLFEIAMSIYGGECWQSSAESLLDEKLWPSDRLPTEQDRLANWVIQRDPGEEWLPGSGSKVHSGGDFLFLASLIKV